ncbi:metal-dependent hydrolase [Massilia sp. 9096]|uniref:metal-dependent hydrolase n=1 Tax=Massilia sp. 9096 TaxID=1500894 RepID=UPI0005603915|nr:metal-dependent hydrolase [Massilia sp. 9096]
MDNLTHSVVGLGIGALVDRSLPDEPDTEHQRVRTRMLLVIGALASNFPDLDLITTRLLEPPLGYLLLHRGHTHTLVGALLELIVLLAGTWLLWPRARAVLRVSARARGAALVTACIGLLLHIGMDGMNVYGVHPFWPFDPSWYYGDLIFIVEPVFWIGFGVPLAAMVRRRGLRLGLFALMALVLLGVTFAGFLQWGSLAGLLALGVTLATIERRARHRPRGARSRLALAAGLALSIAYVGVQAAALQQARTAVASELRRIAPGERLLDTALSAYPANPLCWSFVTVASGADDASVHLRRGLLSIAPGVDAVKACPAALAGAAGPDATPRIAWQSAQSEALATLRTLRQTNCHVDAWLRFARAPALTPADGTATDARWGPPGSYNFSTLSYADLASLPCPHAVPGWGYPRADLLGLH